MERTQNVLNDCNHLRDKRGRPNESPLESFMKSCKADNYKNKNGFITKHFKINFYHLEL